MKRICYFVDEVCSLCLNRLDCMNDYGEISVDCIENCERLNEWMEEE